MLVVTDNFFTRNGLTKLVRRMTDGETRTLGTIRITHLVKKNKEVVKAAIGRLSEANRGC